MSAPIFVPLAAALELPETPSVSQESASSFDENQLPLKAKSPMENGSGSVRNSKNSLKSGSNLSLDQKVINMHNGMPAHHDDIVNGSNNAAPGGGANGLAAAGSDFKRRSNMRLDQDDAAAGTTAAETPPLKEKLPKEATQSKSRVGKDVKGVVTNARKLGAAAASKSRPPLPNHPHPSKVSPRKQ